MSYGSARTLVSRLAVESLAAIAICLTICTVAPAAWRFDDKARTRAERALREGDFAAAEQIYRELLSKDSHDNPARLGLSLALLKQRNLQDAYDHAARVIVADPLSARAHALLGATILASGDFRLSVEEFRTALSLDEGEAMAVGGLAMVEFYENRLDAAVKGLRRAAALAPYEADYIFELGQAAARTERYREAADAYEHFLAIAPKTDADRRARIRGLIDFLRYLGQQSSLYDLAGETRTVVPFESANGLPILELRINNEKNPLRFVLDTGSGMSVVSEATAKRLGLRPVARGGMARAVGGGGRFEIVYGFLQSIDVGDVRVENVPVYIRHFFDEKTTVDGYLGLSVISKFLTSIDYGQHTFTLARNRSSDALDPWSIIYRKEPDPTKPRPFGVDIPLRTTSSGFMSGEVHIEGIEKPWNFIIDTGASISVVSQELAEAEGMSSYEQTIKTRIYGAAGITDDVKTLLLPRVSLGTLNKEKVRAAVLDLDPVNETSGFRQSGILGTNFLQHFRVSFDFQRGLIRLEPLNQPAKGAEDTRPKGM